MHFLNVMIKSSLVKTKMYFNALIETHFYLMH